MAALASDRTTEAWSIALYKSTFLAALHWPTVGDANYTGGDRSSIWQATYSNPVAGESW